MNFQQFKLSSKPQFVEAYELMGEEFGPPRCVCAQCTYYGSWRSILHFNFLVGVISPNLWIFNVVIVCSILAKSTKCDQNAALLTVLGHSLCGLLLYGIVATAGILYWRSIRV